MTLCIFSNVVKLHPKLVMAVVGYDRRWHSNFQAGSCKGNKQKGRHLDARGTLGRCLQVESHPNGTDIIDITSNCKQPHQFELTE